MFPGVARTKLNHITWILLWLSFAFVVAMALAIWVAADRFSVSFLLTYGPRWPIALVLLIAVPAAMIQGRRGLLPLALVAFVLFGPILNFCFPWQRLTPCKELTLRVVTCNVSAQKSIDSYSRLLDVRPDVVALQECHSFHVDPAWPDGWYSQKVEGLTLASRFPIQVIQVARGRFPTGAVLYSLDVDGSRVYLVNLHHPTPRPALRSILESGSGKSSLAATLRNQAASAMAAERLAGSFTGPLIVLGDFNATNSCTVYRKYWSRFANAFERAGLGVGYTKRSSYRGWSFGTRIDHILTRGGWACHRCWVGEGIGSDHLPLIADLSIERKQVSVEMNQDMAVPCAAALAELAPDVAEQAAAMVTPRNWKEKLVQNSSQGNGVDESTVLVCSRFLQDDIEDKFTNLRARHLLHLPRGASVRTLTFSQQDARSAIEHARDEDDHHDALHSTLLDESDCQFVKRLLQFAMVNGAVDRDSAIWLPGDIRCAQVLLYKIKADDNFTTVRISGQAELGNDSRMESAYRGFALRLYGTMSVDTETWRFSEMKILGLGEYWDNGSRNHGSGDHRSVLAVTLNR